MPGPDPRPAWPDCCAGSAAWATSTSLPSHPTATTPFSGEWTGALEPLTGAGALTFSAAIDQGDAVNHLRVICQGDELSLSVNGLPVASATDASHRRGDIGVGVASGPAGQARAEFDSVSVRVP